MPAARPSDSRPVIERGSEEFGRVLAFSDGLFAIAMTLLVVGIAVPELSSPTEGEMLAALRDLDASFFSFFLSFAIVGRYWIAHHQLFRRLSGFDYGLIWLNLAYLAFVAFLPFPTGVLGSYFENPISIALYAATAGIVSGFEVLLFRHAHRHGLLTRALPPDVYRWSAVAGLMPVAFFAASIPVAFLSTTLGALMWLGVVPAEVLWSRRKPANTDAYVG